jgi:hypothetical protein
MFPPRSQCWGRHDVPPSLLALPLGSSEQEKRTLYPKPAGSGSHGIAIGRPSPVGHAILPVWTTRSAVDRWLRFFPAGIVGGSTSTARIGPRDGSSLPWSGRQADFLPGPRHMPLVGGRWRRRIGPCGDRGRRQSEAYRFSTTVTQRLVGLPPTPGTGFSVNETVFSTPASPRSVTGTSSIWILAPSTLHRRLASKA